MGFVVIHVSMDEKRVGSWVDSFSRKEGRVCLVC